MEADIAKGLVPLYLCATIGTTAVGAVDPLLELGKVANEYGVWYHIDAAYAGSLGICPEFRHYLDGGAVQVRVGVLPTQTQVPRDDASELNRRLLEAVNSSGQAFMTHAVVAGMFVVRFAIGATLTEMRHVEATWKLIQAKADGLLLNGSCDKISSSNGLFSL
ncbi:tryptophan decarboxylase TDC1-like [Elaeis guineensis]|uniref:tryptophan decarboxylase TDC1-like n=1 Tax=Elaeis guineensis var. tenera TaxID=51953 RepID=UPI003C6D5CAF